jgi:hypothetical protein
MKTYLIERNIPGVDKMTPAELKSAAATSMAALGQLGEDRIKWVRSFVAEDKTFCIYLAQDEASIQDHARLSGFPADRVTEIAGSIDPATAG